MFGGTFVSLLGVFYLQQDLELRKGMFNLIWGLGYLKGTAHFLYKRSDSDYFRLCEPRGKIKQFYMNVRKSHCQP